MGDRKVRFKAHAAPFGYQIMHDTSQSSGSYASGNRGRVVLPQSSRMKEVPSLDNVEAFMSDPVDLEDESSSIWKVGKRTPQAKHGQSGYQYPENPNIASISRLVLLRQADRALNITWKFNPFRGCPMAAMDELPPDAQLTDEQLEWLEGFKEKEILARATRIQRMSARGLLDLQKTKKKNMKNLTILAWPNSVASLTGKTFEEEVLNNSFHSRHLVSTGSDDKAEDSEHRVTKQKIFKDSAVYMEDEFEKEASKGSPTSGCLTEPEENEVLVTETFDEPPMKEVTEVSNVFDELPSQLDHEVTDGAAFGGVFRFDRSIHFLDPSLQGESVHTCLNLYDAANAPFHGEYQDHPYGICGLAEGSMIDCARENLFLPHPSTSVAGGSQSLQNVTITGALIGTLRNAESIDFTRPSGLVDHRVADRQDIATPELSYETAGNARDVYSVAKPRAHSSPGYKFSKSPARRAATPGDAVIEALGLSSPAGSSKNPYNVPGPVCLGSSGTRPLSRAPKLAQKETTKARLNRVDLLAPGYSGKTYLHYNGKSKAPTPIFPTTPPNAAAVQEALDDLKPCDKVIGFNGAKSQCSASASLNEKAVPSNSALKCSHDGAAFKIPTAIYQESPSSGVTPTIKPSVVDGGRRSFIGTPTYSYPALPLSTSQQHYGGYKAAPISKMTSNENSKQSRGNTPYAPTPMALEGSDREQDGFQHGFLPAAHSTLSSYQSPYQTPNPNTAVDNSHDEDNSSVVDSSPPIPVTPKYARYGGLRLPTQIPLPESDSPLSVRAVARSSPFEYEDFRQNDYEIPGNVRGNSSQPALHHRDSNMSTEAYAGSSYGSMAPASPKPDEGPDTRFAAGARELATSVTRPATPASQPQPDWAQTSPHGAALNLKMPVQHPHNQPRSRASSTKTQRRRQAGLPIHTAARGAAPRRSTTKRRRTPSASSGSGSDGPLRRSPRPFSPSRKAKEIASDREQEIAAAAEKPKKKRGRPAKKPKGAA